MVLWVLHSGISLLQQYEWDRQEPINKCFTSDQLETQGPQALDSWKWLGRLDRTNQQRRWIMQRLEPHSSMEYVLLVGPLLRSLEVKSVQCIELFPWNRLVHQFKRYFPIRLLDLLYVKYNAFIIFLDKHWCTVKTTARTASCYPIRKVFPANLPNSPVHQSIWLGELGGTCLKRSLWFQYSMIISVQIANCVLPYWR